MKRKFDIEVRDPDGTLHVRKIFKTDEKGLPVMEPQKQPNGEIIKVQAFDRFEPMLLRHYAIDALGGRWPGEDRAPWDQVRRRGELLDKITFAQDGVVDVTTEEIQIVKEALEHQGASYLVMYRMGKMLDTDPPATTTSAP